MTDIYQQLDSVYRQLMDKAHEARKSSYSPYSGYAVGAALLAASGKIYLGCNIENASYTPTVCAERVAFFKAVSAGERQFVAIAIVGANAHEEPSRPCPPCGVCRQVMSEFCGPEFVVLLGDREEYQIVPFADLMPYTFTMDNLSSAEPEEESHEPEYEEESEPEYEEESEPEYEAETDLDSDLEDLDSDLEDLDSDIEDLEDLDSDLDDEDLELDEDFDELSDLDDLDEDYNEIERLLAELEAEEPEAE